MRWVVSQIGSREHYAVPRAFHNRGHLHHFYTDLWMRRGSKSAGKISGQIAALANRFHAGLPPGKVTGFNLWTFRRLLRERVVGTPASMKDRYDQFDLIGREFSERVNRHLQRNAFDPTNAAAFLFSTGALETAQYMKSLGVPILVDQLDPAQLDESMVLAEMQKWPGWQELPGEVPKSYYDRLAEEWRLADVILVNSSWSRKNLLNEGVDPVKIIVVPLCYEAEAPAAQARPQSADRPLTVLWIGQIVLRKGIQYLFEAARSLRSANIRFIVAGRIGISQKGLAQAPENVTVLGQVSRQQVIDLFRQADLFVLPTVSDGFAMTQLEAMSFGLPVITTPNCGDVVTPGVDGIIIPACDSKALAEAISSLDRDRDLLRQMSASALEKPLEHRFSLDGYADAVEQAIQPFFESSGLPQAVGPKAMEYRT